MHNFCCTLTLLKCRASNIREEGAEGSLRIAKSLPLQVAAICYRKRGGAVEFLLVTTNGGNKWTFPRDHRKPASRTASPPSKKPRKKPERWAPSSLDTFISTYTQGRVLAGGRRAGICGEGFSFMEVHEMRRPDEPMRRPTWFSPEEARQRLAKGREVKYARELEAVIDRALESAFISQRAISIPVPQRPAAAHLIHLWVPGTRYWLFARR